MLWLKTELIRYEIVEEISIVKFQGKLNARLSQAKTAAVDCYKMIMEPVRKIIEKGCWSFLTIFNVDNLFLQFFQASNKKFLDDAELLKVHKSAYETALVKIHSLKLGAIADEATSALQEECNNLKSYYQRKSKVCLWKLAND